MLLGVCLLPAVAGADGPAAAPSAPTAPAAPAERPKVTLDQLLKLPDTVQYTSELKGGATPDEWRKRFREARSDLESARAALDQSLAELTRLAGKRPIGYRAPSWKFSQWTLGQIKSAGFLYDSSLMASDDAYEILLDGQPSGVIELPIERILDDAPYFGGNSDGSMPSPNEVYEVFKSEFDVAYDEGGLYILTMHPHFMGHRSRAAMLDRLIAYMKGRPGVWFGTHEQIARHVTAGMAQP